MRLTDSAIKAAKAAEKPYKLFDGHGLYLLVNPDGSRWWRLKYRFAGKEKLLALGTYPAVSLKKARDRSGDAKDLLTDGIDPNAARKAEKQARADRESGSFELVAREWHSRQRDIWGQVHAANVLRRLVLYVFPKIGNRPIRDLRASDLLVVLRSIEARGTQETAYRVKQSLGAIFRYAVATQRADFDPSAALKGALAPAPDRHYAAITQPSRVGELMRAIHGYAGSDVTCLALQLLPLVFVRPGELRAAQWDELSFDIKPPLLGEKPQYPEPVWRIPGERMKMGEPHIVPLSAQAVRVLQELHAITGPEGYLFPGARSKARCMSENTLNAALRRMDYGTDEMTGHGFRHMASTILHERGYRSEWIERQLAHGDRNSVRARYNFAEYLPERRRMMQDWADYLDGLADGANVCAIRQVSRNA